MTPRPGSRPIRHVAVLAAVLVAVVAACGRSSEESGGGAVGYSDREPSTTAAPFQMAEPSTTQGPTTIPGPGPTLYLPTTTNPATGEVGFAGEPPPSQGGRDPNVARQPTRPRNSRGPTTTRPPTTTTTLPRPGYPERPLPPSSGFCGSTRYLQSLVSIFTVDGLDIRAVTDEAATVLPRIQAVAPTPLRPDVDTVVGTVRQLVDDLIAANYDARDAGVRAKVQAIVDAAPQWRGFLDSFNRMLFGEVAACPDVPNEEQPAT